MYGSMTDIDTDIGKQFGSGSGGEKLKVVRDNEDGQSECSPCLPIGLCNDGNLDEEADVRLHMGSKTFAAAMKDYRDSDHVAAKQHPYVQKVLAMTMSVVRKRDRFRRAYFQNRNRWFILTFLLLCATAAIGIVSVVFHDGFLKNVTTASLAAAATILTGTIAALKYDSRKDAFEAAAKNLDAFVVELDSYVMQHWNEDIMETDKLRTEFDTLACRFKDLSAETRTDTAILPVNRYSSWPENDYFF